MTIEKRHVSDAELRAEAGDEPKISGYAAIFDTETVIGGYFRERIARGAFSEAVMRDDVRALFNHDPNFVLGRTVAKTLRLSEDSKGLRSEIAPDSNIAWVRDLMATMKRGDVTQMSFAFNVEAQSWDEGDGEKLPLRTVERVKLYDVSVVTYPAYEDSTAAVRSLSEYRASHAKPSIVPALRSRLRIDLDLRARTAR